MLTSAELALLYGNQGANAGKNLAAKVRTLKKTIQAYNQDTENAKLKDQKAFLKVQQNKLKEENAQTRQELRNKRQSELAAKKKAQAEAAHKKQLQANSKARQAKIAQREKTMEQNIKNKMLNGGFTPAQANKAIQNRRNVNQAKRDYTTSVMSGKMQGKVAPVQQKPVQLSTNNQPKINGPKLNPIKPSVKGQITKTANKQTMKSAPSIPTPASPAIKSPGAPMKIASKSEMDNPVVKKLMK